MEQSITPRPSTSFSTHHVAPSTLSIACSHIIGLYLCCVLLCTASPQAWSKGKERRSVVLIETSVGNIRVALSDDTPLHRDNFLRLASEGYYDGTLFHRVIRDFMIQGGDPDSKEAPADKLLGEGGPGYTLPAELDLPFLYHWRGALAAAREADEVNPERESSGSQFYIVWGKKQKSADIRKAQKSLEEQGIHLTQQMIDDYTTLGGTPHLDGQYTVFGEVIEGIEIVEHIQSVATDSNDRPIQDIRVLHTTIEQRSKKAQARRR